MPQDRQDNPFFLEAGLDVSELKTAVTAAEKFYLSFSKSMGKVIDGLESQEEQQEKTGKAAKKAAQDQEKSSKKSTRALGERFKIIKKVSGGVRDLAKREKTAIEGLGVSWGNLAGLIGGATVIGLIGKAMKDWLAFDKVIRDINVSMSATPGLLKEASGMVQGLTGYLDMSREELAGMVKQMGELRMIRGDTDQAAKAFRQLSMDTIHLAKSMDVSTDAVVGMFDQFTRVYKLPHHRLRNISASMKFIQEQTSISGQELMSFGDSLGEVISRMIKVSGDGAAAATADLMAMAGVVKDMGIQPEKVSQMFGEAMKLSSEQGAQFLSFITEGTGKSAEQVRKMMQAGDMQTPLTMLIERIKKESPEWLEWNEDWLTETTGFTFAELRNIQNASVDGLQDLMARNRKEYIKGQKHAEEARKRQHKLSMLWNNLKRIAEKVWLGIGGIFVKVATKVADVLVPALEKLFGKLNKWMSSPEGAQAIHKWSETTAGWFSNLATWMVKGIPGALKKMGEFWDKYLKDKFEWLMTPQGGAAVQEWFSDALDTIKTMAKGFKGIAEFIGNIKDMLKTDVDRLNDQQKEFEARWKKGVPALKKHIDEQMKIGGTFRFGNIRMQAAPGNIREFLNRVRQEEVKGERRAMKMMGIDEEKAQAHVKAINAQLVETLNIFDQLVYSEQALRDMAVSKGAADTGGTGVFAPAPDLPRRAAPAGEPKIPPTSVKTPDVQVTVEKQSPLKVTVKTETAATEQLLIDIKDALHRILVSGRGHASRNLLAAQRG